MSAAEQNPLCYSIAESNRFNLRVFRGGQAAALLGNDLPSLLWKERADVLILRLPSAMMRYVGQLGQLGLPYCVVDGHLTFALDLTAKLSRIPEQGDLVFTPITLAQADDLDSLIDVSFDGYLNQYSANPILCGLDWKAGYKEWARTVIWPGAPQRRGWIVSHNGVPVGFGTFTFDGPAARSMLYGILPSARGAGLYKRMFLGFAALFQAEGVSTIYNSTQLDNLASQKVWADAGSRMHSSEVTVHINALFGCVQSMEQFTYGKDTTPDLQMALEHSESLLSLTATGPKMKREGAYQVYRATLPVEPAQHMDVQVFADLDGALVATSYLQNARSR
jgi:hypothetical protein